MFLGIFLGHDASASLFDDNGLIKCVIQERHSGLRHDFGINIKTIDLLLEACNVKILDIRAVGISSTQHMPAIIQSPDEIQILYSPSELSANTVRLHGLNWLTEESGLIVDRSSRDKLETRFENFIDDNLVRSRKLPKHAYQKAQFFSMADPMLVNTNFTSSRKTLKQVLSNAIDNIDKGNLVSAMDLSEDLTLSIRGFKIPGVYWSHHACHAASNATLYDDERIIITHDGGLGFQSGGIWQLKNEELKLLTLHELELGQLYDHFAFRLGLGSIGGAGKLMGLAAYGKGVLFPNTPFYGTPSDLIQQFKEFDGSDVLIESHFDHLWNLCIDECRNLEMDVSNLGKSELVTESAPTEIAHFIQRLLEKTLLIIFQQVNAKFKSSSIGFSGGVALNCPSNSNLIDSSGFHDVFIEPHCEDGGCSIGAAQLTFMKYHQKLPSQRVKMPTSEYAYKGVSQNIESKVSNLNAKRLAQLVVENKVIGIFSNNSEIGPRALGHRSIIANPRFENNWDRVNAIKGREAWRPFAPAVLKSHLRKYFTGGPDESPFMLFNYQVKKEFLFELPAITHFDGTSRVQTITEKDQPFFGLLSALLALNQPPIVMNTSFNGPGQPILETEPEAIYFFENSELDALLLNDTLLEK